MLEEFEAHLRARRRSPNTIRIRMIYLRQLNAHTPLENVTIEDMEALLAGHPEWSTETVTSAISSWAVFYKWAVRRGRVAEDPTIDLERPRRFRTVKTLADDDRIREAIDKASPRDRAILLLGREGGLRRNEIASLHRNDRHGDWLVVVGKGQRQRKVRLTPRLAAALDALEGSGFYFPGRGVPHISVTTVYKITVSHIGTAPHSLRRSAITAVYRNSGGDIRMAQEFAGHASPATTAIYVPVTDSDLILAGGYASLAA